MTITIPKDIIHGSIVYERTRTTDRWYHPFQRWLYENYPFQRWLYENYPLNKGIYTNGHIRRVLEESFNDNKRYYELLDVLDREDVWDDLVVNIEDNTI